MLSEAWRVAYGERKSPSALLCLIFSLVVQRLRINQRFLVKHQGSLTRAILIAFSLSYCFFSHPSFPFYTNPQKRCRITHPPQSCPPQVSKAMGDLSYRPMCYYYA